MKILQQINFADGLGADRWIVGGYRDAFQDLGHEHFFLSAKDNFAARIPEVNPHILMIAGDKVAFANIPALRAARKKGTTVLVWVDSMLAHNVAVMELIHTVPLADYYIGETEEEWMEEFVARAAAPYVKTPNAANAKLHFPVVPTDKYRCDIAYLGANLPLKQDAFRKLLFPLRKKYAVRIYGPGWTIKDNAMRAMALLARKVGLMEVNNIISRARLSVPPEEERELYSSAVISLNIHEARQNTTMKHMILNERTFKIPACGGFEICDNVPTLRKYFTEEEMVMAHNADDWFSKIDYYMDHPEERNRIRAEGIARALRDHTYHARARRIVELYNNAHDRNGTAEKPSS